MGDNMVIEDFNTKYNMLGFQNTNKCLMNFYSMICDKGQDLLGWGFRDILVPKLKYLRCGQFGGQTQNGAIITKMHHRWNPPLCPACT